MHIPISNNFLPTLSSDQMQEVDRLMTEDFNIQLIQMMENAGRSLARLAQSRFLSKRAKLAKVTILAGTGGNGGGAFVCARHLRNFGADVTVYLTKEPPHYSPIPSMQLEILQKMDIPCFYAEMISIHPERSLIIDGIIGYSLKGEPSGTPASLIKWANSQSSPILSLDVPSGFDSYTGKASDICIKASATMTLALPKLGLYNKGNANAVGELYLADISVPPELFQRLSPPLIIGNLFEKSEIIQLK